ncbi:MULTISPECIES: hypothetical protein [Mycobacterium]|uniref:Uncharacterized protein n=1 Tax=Mycobacterium kiyosense TaxID=2871094 RepID=A0A9P3UWP3_9MYCO|nr:MULTISPECIES: hypothetical protein [Mycobacterium]BDB42192.1 hypothetical protein IWGMT90018_26380 [Mycobacterium kiyosense]BDE14533.1 hypothetical protein MKCMC460_33930 [Mycobacterium sp. 20KCMC460]GLB92407.1 hypothetical protein SRL2020130_52240 [Mycobacterium kiyosense]GLC10655.1 hypothetical protein SRL2020411_53010 [Mycobacterium kiyosense]GLC16637.1 hypothetical protein SRL2020448_52400 [Mycobacterium kiyosense]
MVLNYTAAVKDSGQPFSESLDNLARHRLILKDHAGLTVVGTVNPKLCGRLRNLFTIMNIFGCANILSPSFIPRQTAHMQFAQYDDRCQHFGESQNTHHQHCDRVRERFFGPPLVVREWGVTFAKLNGLATSAETREQAIATGHPLGALAALIATPAKRAERLLDPNTRKRDDQCVGESHGGPARGP